jgi:acyl-CoA thioester hydrolase
VTGLVAHSECHYFSPIAFPEAIEVGLRVARLGTSSVTYELAIFQSGAELAAAQGRFVHVYVDRETSRPVPIPANMRVLLDPLVVPNADG